MSFTLAIIGRPNVGKSTLFNRLAGKKLALVDNTPGVTRDRREAPGRLGDLRFKMIDTAGLEDAENESLEGRMREQTEEALRQADCALLVIDGRAGVTPMDEHFARLVRKGKAPLIVIVNKCEGMAGKTGISDAYRLGLGDPVAISAEHGEGLSDLYDHLLPFNEASDEIFVEEDEDAGEETGEETGEEIGEEIGEMEAEDGDDGRLIKIAIVGRPNVGKSTIINRLLGEDRLLTGPEAGITRDAITLPWSHGGREVELVDTAGLRRRAKVVDKLEKMSVHDTERAVRLAQVVVLVLDAEMLLEKQDLAIARQTVEEGRALLIAVNKWDLVKDPKETVGRLSDRLERSLAQVKGIPVVTFSAKTGKKLDHLMPAIFAAYDIWNRRVPTAALNRWLAEITAYHPPPLSAGRRLRLRYVTQAKARPPTFALFANKPGSLPDSYVRYLENSLRETFDLPGTPLRVFVRKGENPYAK